MKPALFFVLISVFFVIITTALALIVTYTVKSAISNGTTDSTGSHTDGSSHKTIGGKIQQDPTSAEAHDQLRQDLGTTLDEIKTKLYPQTAQTATIKYVTKSNAIGQNRCKEEDCLSSSPWCFDKGKLYCEGDADGWLTWFRRIDNSLLFNQSWAEYKNGFGNPMGNYWLGLEKLHRITHSTAVVMRVELTSWLREKKWAEYEQFKVLSEQKDYTVTHGKFSSNMTIRNADTYYEYNLTYPFSTYNRENGHGNRKCAHSFGNKGGWWYYMCGHMFPTAKYPDNDSNREHPYMMWFQAFDGDSKQSIAGVEMKLKITLNSRNSSLE